MHQAVFFKRMHLARFGLARFKEAKRFGDRHLIDKNLIFAQFLFRNAVAGLNDRCLGGFFRGGDLCGLGKELTDGNRVGGVIRPLINDLKRIIRADYGGCYLNTARTPAIRHRHFAPGKRHLIPRDRNGLKQRAPDHAFGLFIKIGKVIVRCPVGGIFDSLFHGITPRPRVGMCHFRRRTLPDVPRPRHACGAPVQVHPGNRHSVAA